MKGASRERFRKLCDPNRAFEWRWVITLDRQPKVPPGYAADASYIRLRAGLQLAAAQGSSFSWLIESGNGTSALVWERRGGHP